MSAWEKLAETRIQEALESGELTPPPAGEALDLREYFALPESERVGLTLLRDAGVVPPEVELLRQIAALEKAIEQAPAPRAAGLQREVETVRVQWRIAMERRVRLARET